MSMPRWFYAARGHCDKYGCDIYPVEGGFEVACPDESTKEEVAAYIQSKLGKVSKDNGEGRLFIMDSYPDAKEYAEFMVSQDDVINLYNNGHVRISIPNHAAPAKFAKECISRIKDMWGEEEVNFSYGAPDFEYSLDLINRKVNICVK